MELVTEALIFAAKAHDGMRRKLSNSPYILHPMEVASIIGTITDDGHVIAAGLLHDTVEDTNVTNEDIKRAFGERVAFLVSCETENKYSDRPSSETWRLRKEESLKVLRDVGDIDVKILWLGDKLSNMRSFYRDYKIEGAALWNNFNQKDSAQHKWYYDTIAEYTKELSNTIAWQEYKRLVNSVFDE